MSRRSEIQSLIRKHQRRLHKLKEKEATFGINTPPEIITEIEDIQAEIENLQTESEQLEPETNKSLVAEIGGFSQSHIVKLATGIMIVSFLLTFGVIVYIFVRSQTTSTSAESVDSTPIVSTITATLPVLTETPTLEPTFTLSLESSETPTPTDTASQTFTPTPPSATPTPTPASTPSLTPTSTQQISSPIPQLGLTIDDFENYDNTSIISTFIVNRNAGNDGDVTLVGPPHIYQGQWALAFEFDIRNSRPDHYVGFDREFSSQDWSNYSSLCLWIESDGSNRSLVVQFGESRYKFWKNIVSLARISVKEHCVPLQDNHQIDLRAIGYYGVYVEGPPQGQGVIYIDNVQIAQ